MRKTLFIAVLSFVTTVSISGMSKAFDTDEENIRAEINRLADKCWSERMSLADSSIIWGTRAIELSNKYGYLEELPRIYNYMGAIYIHMVGEIDTARSYLHNALEISLEFKDSLQIAYSYVNLGDIYILSENIPVALFYTQKGLEYFKIKNDINGIAYGYEDMGTIYSYDKKHEESIYYLKKANSIREKEGKSSFYAFNLEFIGHNYFELGELDSAMKYFTESYEIQTELLPEAFSSGCLFGMASVYDARGDYGKAIENIEQVIAINDINFKPWRLVNSHTLLAIVYAKLGNQKAGEQHLELGMKAAIRTGLHPQILKAKRTYFKFYATIGDYDKANHYYQQFESYYDTVTEIRQMEAFHEIESNFKYRENIATIESKINEHRIERLVMFLIIFIFTLIAGFTWWRLKEKNEANRQLRAVNQTKNKLFSVISHDLRSPFNALLGFSQILSDTIKEGEYTVANEYSDILHHKAKETLNLVDNLLTWSKSQTGKLVYNPQVYDIDPLFSELEKLFRSDSKNNKIELTFISEVESEYRFDLNIIRIILVNFITNALKFTPDGGKIVVSAFIDTKTLCFQVKDTGPGLSKELIDSIKNKIAINKPGTGVRKEVGAGIGLTLVQELVAQHKGEIQIDSDPGIGSSFTVRVPL